MTHEQAMLEVERRQRQQPDAKWLATRCEDGWTVARIDLAPSAVKPTGTVAEPPPVAPREGPYSELERVTRLYGSAG